MYSEEFPWPAKAVAALFGSILLFDLIVVIPSLLKRDSSSGLSTLALLLGSTTAILSLMLLIFGRLRASVEIDSVVVAFGPFKDRVQLVDIRSAEPVSYRFWDFGGWGIRFGRRGKMYNVPGDHFRAVDITRNDNRHLLFSSHDPEAFARAIEERLPGRSEPLPA